MTSVDMDIFLDAVLAFDLDMQREEMRARETLPAPAFLDADEHRRLNRQHEMACEMAREGESAEIRTWYRLEVLRLEKIMAPHSRRESP